MRRVCLCAVLLANACTPEQGAVGTRTQPLAGSRIGEETAVEPPVFGHDTQAYQNHPAAAYEGSSYLVVWREQVDLTVPQASAFAARFDAAGTAIEPRRLLVGEAAGMGNVDLVFDGANYVAVWGDAPNPITDNALWLRRITRQGQIVEGAPVLISRAPGNAADVQIASNGTVSLVVWLNLTEHVLRAARINQAGRLLDAEPITVFEGATRESFPIVTSNGDDFLVVWNTNGGIRQPVGFLARRVSATGQLLEAEPLTILEPRLDVSAPSAGAHDGTYWILWTEPGALQNTTVTFARHLSTAGVLSEQRTLFTRSEQFWGLQVANFPAGPFVYWNSTSAGPMGAQLSPEGNIAGTVMNLAANAPSWITASDLAVSDSGGLLANSEAGRVLRATRLTESGSPIHSTAQLVSASPNSQVSPAAAYGPSNGLVVWQDGRSEASHSSLFAALIDHRGKPTSGAAFEVVRSSGNLREPAVAHGAGMYLVVWEDSATIVAKRVDEGGRVLDTNPIKIAPADRAQRQATVAFDGRNFWIAWEDERALDGVPDVYAARVSPEGVVLDTNSIAIAADATRHDLEPVLAAGKGSTLLVWTSLPVDSGPGELRGVRLTTGGRISTPAPVAPVALTPYSGRCDTSVAFDGQNWVVVWADTRESEPAQYDIFASRVDAAGVALDTPGVRLSSSQDDEHAPRVAFDGTRYVLIWSKKTGEYSELLGAGFQFEGLAGEPLATALTERSLGESTPDLRSASGAQLVLTYQRYVAAPELRVNRVFTRAISAALKVEPAPCPGGSDCVSCPEGSCSENPDTLVAGAAGAAGAPALDDSQDTGTGSTIDRDAGCACRVFPTGNSSPAGVFAVALLSLIATLRRERSAHTRTLRAGRRASRVRRRSASS